MGTKRYNRSEQLAYNNGFRAVYDAEAYNGRYFVKDDKKWIHNLDALKAELGVISDDEVDELGYDVQAYYRFH